MLGFAGCATTGSRMRDNLAPIQYPFVQDKIEIYAHITPKDEKGSFVALVLPISVVIKNISAESIEVGSKNFSMVIDGEQKDAFTDADDLIPYMRNKKESVIYLQGAQEDSMGGIYSVVRECILKEGKIHEGLTKKGIVYFPLPDKDISEFNLIVRDIKYSSGKEIPKVNILFTEKE
jgi:hypothetical protein